MKRKIDNTTKVETDDSEHSVSNPFLVLSLSFLFTGLWCFVSYQCVRNTNNEVFMYLSNTMFFMTQNGYEIPNVYTNGDLNELFHHAED